MQRVAMLCAMVCVSSVALAQTAAGPSGPAAEVQRYYATVKNNILKSADLMPAEGYSFKPVPDIRVYARILNHVTEAQFRTCGAINGVKDPTKPPADSAD